MRGAGTRFGLGIQEIGELTGGHWSGTEPNTLLYFLTRKGHSLNLPQSLSTRHPYFSYHGGMSASSAS
jgi:hypothetical protein